MGYVGDGVDPLRARGAEETGVGRRVDRATVGDGAAGGVEGAEPAAAVEKEKR